MPLIGAMAAAQSPHRPLTVWRRPMAMEPITLFARRADPAGVARRLRELARGVQIDGPDDRWSKAVVTFAEGKKQRTLTFTHDPAYYAEPNSSTQMDGMRGYFSNFPETERKDR